MRHKSSLGCVAGITYVHTDTIFTFYCFFFFFFLTSFNIHLYCLVGCLSMIVWTYAVLGVLYACFVFLYLYLFSAIQHVSHGKVL